ncbi:MAG: hypothetical protein ACRDIV_21785 [Ktedonobacteraceae bacterium]
MNETEHDDGELEISDLPGGRKKSDAPTLLHILAARPRLRSRLWQAGIATVAVCLLFVVFPSFYSLLQAKLSGIFAHPSQSSPVVASQPSPLAVEQDIQSQFNGKKVLIWNASTPPVVMPFTTLDATPAACPQNTLTQNFDAPSLPAGVGGAPLWVTGFSGPRAILNHLVRAHPPELGWYQQIQLVGATNFSGAIKLQGGIVGNIYPLWFGFDPHERDLIVNYQYNPGDSSISNHTTDDQQWNIRPINLYIPQAGCYYLQAIWDGGSWIAYFAAGR